MINTFKHRFIRGISKSVRRRLLAIIAYSLCSLTSGSELTLNGTTIY
jgi:hypothetical protein